MIRTCIIFCGGYGSRLGSITKKIPKPMVPVMNKPFLEHLLIQLKSIGIRKVFLLVGYKHKKIKNYFKFGKKFGLKIQYSYNHPDFKTGYRLNAIKKKIRENFLLMYCDNYSPFNLKKHFNYFKKTKSLITLSIHKKKFGNVSKLINDKAKYYLKRKKNIKFVEIGYMVCSKNLLKFINHDNISLSNYFVNKKIKKKISALEIKNKYLSISDKQRLIETRKYFKKKNIILIDRDGVLNLKSKNSRYITKLDELKMNDKIISILKKFPKMKYVCITNQAGISTGEVKELNLKKINKHIKNYLKKNNINLIDFFVSYDHFKSDSFYRKPNPGNFLRAAEKYKLLLDKTFYIGDDPRDILASYNSNTKCVYIGKRSLINKQNKIKLNDIILKNLENSIFLKYRSNY